MTIVVEFNPSMVRDFILLDAQQQQQNDVRSFFHIMFLSLSSLLSLLTQHGWFLGVAVPDLIDGLTNMHLRTKTIGFAVPGGHMLRFVQISS